MGLDLSNIPMKAYQAMLAGQMHCLEIHESSEFDTDCDQCKQHMERVLDAFGLTKEQVLSSVDMAPKEFRQDAEEFRKMFAPKEVSAWD